MPERSLKKRVSLEESKVRQTTHWDMDYLPRDEVQALYARGASRPAEAFSSVPSPKDVVPWPTGSYLYCDRDRASDRCRGRIPFSIRMTFEMEVSFFDDRVEFRLRG